MARQLIIALLFGVAVLQAGQEQAPDWVHEASTRTLPTYPPEAHSATLIRETHITVEPDGSTVEERRGAVRILTTEGKDEAYAFVRYYRKVTKIRDFKAWLITPNGSTKTYGKNEIADVGLQADFELYADERAKVVGADNAIPGSTFAWSAEVEDRPNEPQEEWRFQERDPVMSSRLVLTLPTGWEAKAVTFNHEPIVPIVDGNTYTWELKNLDYIKREKQCPGETSLAPWLGVTYYAKDNSKAPREWKDISVRETALDEPQTTTSDAMVAEVRQLTASSKDALDQIRAVGRFVQQLKYVEIATNLAHGGGSLPHPAAQVFEKRYGDCKDKANLMRTMLRQIGVPSFMVVVYSGDRNHVHPQWASGEQFNHMILAIQVPESVSLPAVMKHPVLGNLLIFDPTDPYIPLGLIPDYEQSSYGLLLAGDKGGAIQLPVAPPEANRTDLIVDGRLTGDGALQANLVMKNRADEASGLRYLREEKHAEFESELRAWLQRNVKQLADAKLDAADTFDKGELDVHFDFTAPRYAQLMQGRMLVFKPAIVEPYHAFPLQAEKRVHPLVLDSQAYHKEVHVKLPDGFKVDETPDATSFHSSFGTYSSECKVTGDEVVFTEDLNITATTLPAEQYKEARDFFGHVVGAEREPMVLVKN